MGDWGIRPDQVVDLLALTGDTADNVPGIPGIGLKTGSKLLEQFGDLETLLASVDQVSRGETQREPPRFRRRRTTGASLIILRDDLEASTSTGKA